MLGSGLFGAPAGAQDRCSGTLCDWYYGGPAPEGSNAPAGQAAPAKPLILPNFGQLIGGGGQAGAAQGGAPAKQPLVGVGGGGLASVARGEPQQRCSGTLCDFYYGGPPPETPETPAARAGAPQPTVEGAADADPDTESGVRYELRPSREAKPGCVAPAQDPWKCFR